MPVKKFKIGVIGCGTIFDRHIEAIKTNSANYKLVALCDSDKRKLDIRSREYDVSGFTDHKEMLKKMKGKMDLVAIATPNSLHYQQAMDCLAAGMNILVEKPIDFRHQRVKEISEFAKKVGKKAYAVLQVRFNPTVGMVREALDKGFLGDIRSVSLTQRWQRPESYFDSWRADLDVGGRTLYEVGIHYLDIVQLLFGLPRVLGSATFNNKHKHVKFEDTVFSIFQFPSGASGSLEVTIASEPSNLECSLSIMGSEGFIKIGGRALDAIERASFASKISEDKWNNLTKKYGNSLEPNSYGTHAGSCPNHPTLYAEIAAGRGIAIEEAINSIEFIERVYEKEAK
ncbi:MAG: Gfo/Idh/MocA family oxidoreductase [Candidatus Berkelbacteria bacterium]|nr:Gfo/Idh/MocA family oxidoreductase [Candidatus Berkelbacteria bacterium]